MKRKELDNILRNLLVAGNIVTVPFEQMREIRKELDRSINKEFGKNQQAAYYGIKEQMISMFSYRINKDKRF